MGPAGLGIPRGRVEISSITAQHRPTALQALPPPHLAGTQENLRMTWEGNGICFLPRYQRKGGSKPGGTQREALKEYQVNRMAPSFSRASQSQLRLSLWKAMVFLTFRSGVKLLNGVLSEGRNTTWEMKLQIPSFFLWIQRAGLKLLRTPISFFSFHRAFIKNLYPAWKMWEGDRVESLWYFAPKELRCPSV